MIPRGFGPALALLLATGAPAAAQEPSLGAEGEVGLRAWVRPAVSSAVGHRLPMLGVGGALRLSSIVELGGEGVLGLERVAVRSESSPERAEVTLGYGGVLLRYHLYAPPGRGGWSGELLVGAGTARMYSALVDAELGSENFAVVEPALSWRRALSTSFEAALSAGYRFTPGADPLPGVAADDFQGPTFSLSLSYVRDP